MSDCQRAFGPRGGRCHRKPPQGWDFCRKHQESVNAGAVLYCRRCERLVIGNRKGGD